VLLLTITGLLMVVRGISGARLTSGRGFPLGVPVVILGVVLQWLTFLAIVFAPIAGFLLWRRYRPSQRGAAVASFASQHGMSYSAVGYVDSPGYDFPLLRGDNTGYDNVLAGLWQDLPVKEADYWFSTRESFGSGQVSRYRSYFSIVVVDLAVTVPYVSVRKNSLPGPEEPFDQVDFEPEDFNRKFSVRARDTEFAVTLIDAGMIQWLMSTGGEFAFDIGGCNLLVACGQLPVTGLVRLLDAATGFVDHIPPELWAKYGGQAADSHDGGTPR
jgi:hypothetical protein